MKTGDLADVLEECENGVTNYTKNGKCSGCGNCCSNFLPLTEDEIKVIKAHIKKHNIDQVKHLTVLSTAMIDMTCPFLEMNGDKKCRIYEVRPAVCRYFICDKKQQVVPDWKYLVACKRIQMRETFFGD